MKSEKLMDAKGINEAVEKIADEIKKCPVGKTNFVLIGLVTRGAALAERIAKTLSKKAGKTDAPINNGKVRRGGRSRAAPVGSLDITFYRDDVGSIARQPLAKQTRIPVDINGRNVILVDDVLFTGRSIRAALDELMDFGRPASVRLAALIDRGHRELPIQADFTGVKIETGAGDDIKLNLKEIDGKDEVVLVRKGASK